MLFFAAVTAILSLLANIVLIFMYTDAKSTFKFRLAKARVELQALDNLVSQLRKANQGYERELMAHRRFPRAPLPAVSVLASYPRGGLTSTAVMEPVRDLVPFDKGSVVELDLRDLRAVAFKGELKENE